MELQKSFGLGILIIVFLVLPFLFNPVLPDVDLSIKLIVISIILLIAGIYGFIKKPILTGKGHGYTIILALFILVLTGGLFSSYNVTDGISEIVRMILPFTLVFFWLKIFPLGQFRSQLTLFGSITLIGLCVFTWFQLIESELFVNHTISASLANKNFLCESLILLIAISIAGWSNMNKFRFIPIIATITGIVTVLFLRSTSGNIALGFILLWVLVSFIVRPGVQRRRRKLLISLFTFCVLLTISVFFARHHYSKEYDNRIEQFKDIYHFRNLPSESATTSFTERLFLWRNTIILAGKNLITGIGTANWKILWPAPGLTGPMFISSGAIHYEHPHNEFLLIISENGVPGLILYLSLFVVIGVQGIKKLRQSNNATQFIFYSTLLSALPAVLIMNMFSFPLHRPFTAILFSIAPAFIFFDDSKEKSINPVRQRLIALLFIIAGIFSLLIWTSRYSAESNLAKAFIAQSEHDFNRMQRQLRKINTSWYPIDGTSTPIDWYKGFAHYYSGATDSALYYFKNAEKQNPYHIQLLSDIGAIMENKNDHDEAEKYFKKVLTIVPLYMEARYNLALSHYRKNHFKEALNCIQQLDSKNDSYITLKYYIILAYADSCFLETDKIQIAQQDWITKESVSLIDSITHKNPEQMIKILRDSLQKKLNS
jgi:O-antigen ligase